MLTLGHGLMPLGPFIYLTRESRDIAAVICRRMESRVESVVDSVEYELESIDDLEQSGLAVPPWLKETESPVELLRLPSASF